MEYKFTRKQLRNKYIEDFEEGDLIFANGVFLIEVKYGKYNHPSVLSTVSRNQYGLNYSPSTNNTIPSYITYFISNRRDN